MPALVLDFDPGLERDAFRRQLADHLARLPVLQARAFTMRDVEAMAPARICAHLAITEEELHELLFQARLAMCRALAGPARA